MRVKASLSLIILMTVAALGGAGLALVATNPKRVGPAGVTLWFILVLLAISGFLAISFFILKRRRFAEATGLNLLNSSVRQALLIAGWLVFLLALSSLRQLSLRDAVLVGILLGLVEFYFRTKQ